LERFLIVCYSGGFEVVSGLPSAFVLFNVESGCEDDVLRELRKIEGMEEAYVSYGVYDLVARVRRDTMENLKELITFKVRRIDKVRSTLTLILTEE
jgi:DNA-binding Lrp family transcriptional regulator